MPDFYRHEVDEDAPASELVFTFGGVAPVASVSPGTTISTSTRRFVPTDTASANE